MPNQTVSSGVTSSGLTVRYPDSLEVQSGGTLLNTLDYQGATVQVDAGGTASGTDVERAWILVAGQALGTQLYGIEYNGGEGYEIVSSGAVESGGTIYTSALLVVSSGGSLQGETISSGGSASLQSGATANGLVVSNGGYANVSSGANATGVVVSSGGTISLAVQVFSGEALNASTNAVTSTTIFGGATLLSGALLAFNAATVLSGGTLSVTQDFSNIDVQAGGNLVGSGTLGDNITVEGMISGLQIAEYANPPTPAVAINSGGVGIGLQVNYGAAIEIFVGGTTSGTVLVDDNLQDDDLQNSDTVYGVASTTRVGAGDIETIETGGVTVSATVSGTELVEPGGSASAAVIASGGVMVLGSGGSASGTIIENGGELRVLAGASASGIVVESGGVLLDSSGALLSGVSVQGGGTVQLSGLVVSAGQVETITPQSLLPGTTVASGGVVVVQNVEVMSGGDLVDNGVTFAQAQIDPGGTASGIVGGSGGNFFVFGSVVGDQVNGAEIVASGGVESDGVVSSGGNLSLEAGAVANGTVISRGGAETLIGGIAGAGTVVEGGVLDFKAGLMSGVVVSGGTLEFSSLAVSAGQTFTASAGSVVSGATLDSGAVISAATIIVSSGGVFSATSQTLLGPQTTIDVQGGGVFSATVPVSVGPLTVESGGSFIGPARLGLSGYFDPTEMIGGLVSGATFAGPKAEVQSGGLLEGVTVSGGKVTVDQGATASGDGRRQLLAAADLFRERHGDRNRRRRRRPEYH